jgi:hypothetical protein
VRLSQGFSSGDDGSCGAEDAPEAVGASQTLVVQVLSQNAADWLEMRLKPLVLRTLRGLVGSSFGVRFQTD